MDTFLSSFFQSRSQAEHAIKKGLVKGQGFSVIKKASHKVRAGEIYFITCSEDFSAKEPLVLKPYIFPVHILFEDEHLLVINKPTGLTVHPGPGHKHDTLVNALFHKTTLSSGVAPLRPGIVHRLDKDVSGLMILSKTKKAEELLIEQFKQKKIHRLYHTLTCGTFKEIPSPISSFIGRHTKDRKKFYSFEQEKKGAKKAITHCRLIKSFKGKIHLMECRLETGRTHQVRVHLKSRGLPILGDSLYFPARQQKKHLEALNLKKELFSFKGLALYSAELEFSHPIHKKPLRFEIPWPVAFHPLLKALSFKD